MTGESLASWPEPLQRQLTAVARCELDRRRFGHCILTEVGGEVVVRDLCCTNGTWINGWRVERGRLRPGDEMSIAHMRSRLEGAPASHATVANLPDE